MTANDKAWLSRVEQKVKLFSNRYGVLYRNKQRERAASFEIGCLHMLLGNYESVGEISPKNLTDIGEFRYLTSPTGNPNNFSWIECTIDGATFQIRQQVRVKSHWHNDIAFCPDIVVLKPKAKIDSENPPDYANGKKPFFSVQSNQVVSAHECKSLAPFPELLVSFTGLFQAAHSWFDPNKPKRHVKLKGKHLAPCLFIGGDSRPIQRRMIGALESVFPINIVTGLHWGRFKLDRKNDKAKYIDLDPPTTPITFGNSKRRLIITS
jgi:hypothetical protein